MDEEWNMIYHVTECNQVGSFRDLPASVILVEYATTKDHTDELSAVTRVAIPLGPAYITAVSRSDDRLVIFEAEQRTITASESESENGSSLGMMNTWARN